jgi:predicted DNA-binding transcriptional regulator AlpA
LDVSPEKLLETNVLTKQRPATLSPQSPRPERFLTWEDLFERGLVSSKTQARRLWEHDAFVRPVHLSQRVICWKESEIEKWIASRTSTPIKSRRRVRARLPKSKLPESK